MRSKVIFSLLLLSLITLGCSGNTATEPAASDDSTPEVEVAVTEGGSEIELTPDNTLIQFVGTHFGKDPDPDARTGKFEDFAGKAIVADGELQSVSVEIQMASVQTGMDKLNNHLQAEDFFSVREYPTAKFESQSITAGDDGQHTITGELTLHSATKEVSFPATVDVADGELKLSGKMTLDRTEFGMDKMTDKVNSNVELTFEIGSVE